MYCERDPDPNARTISNCESHTCMQPWRTKRDQQLGVYTVYIWGILYRYEVPLIFVPNDLHTAAHLNDALVI